MDQVLAAVDEAIRQRRRLLIGVVNAAKMVNMRRDAALRRAVLQADLVLADGMAVVWASKILRRALPQRVAGIDLMLQILARGQVRGYRVYCLGAAEQVVRSAVDVIRAKYPGVVLAGWHHGYFEADQESAIVRQIEAARPDVLFVAMSSPKKERFLARWVGQMGVPVCHGVGGSFDVLAGKVRRAPGPWQRLGLEWLYRVGQEPRRLWRRYLVTNALFCGMLLREIGSEVRQRRSVLD